MTPSRLRRPAFVHYAALGTSFVAILWIGRDQWFFGDDWAILAPHLDDSAMLPHVGHWNLIPALVFPLIRNWLGLGSYLPFLTLAVSAHIVVAHLSWRVLGRVGASPWVATLLSVFVMLFGGGAENLLWAFQFGFMGAIALGLIVVLLFDRERLTWPVIVAIIACSVVAPMFSGTAIPVLAAAAVVGWVRHGFLRMFPLLLPAVIGYLSWYLFIAREHSVPSGGISGISDVPLAIVYAAGMLGGGLGRALPWIGLGVIPAIGIAIWFFATVRKNFAGPAAPAYALVIGVVVFIALTAISRSSLGFTAAAAQRYAYVIVVLLVPALGIMLSWFALRGRAPFLAVASLLGVVIVFNVVLLVFEAQGQAAREASSRERVLATLERVLADSSDTQVLAASADPTWAPDLLGADVLWLHDAGQFAVTFR